MLVGVYGSGRPLMVFFMVDDQFHKHPKVERLLDEGMAGLAAVPDSDLPPRDGTDTHDALADARWLAVAYEWLEKQGSR